MSKPVKQFRAGNISASIFMNTVKKDGKEYKFPTIQLQRSYKKEGEENWTNESMNCKLQDCAKIQIILGEVQKELMLKAKSTDDTEN